MILRRTDLGSIVILRVVDDGARVWFLENVASEDWQWLGPDELAVEPRCAEDICADFLSIRGSLLMA